MPKYAYGYIPDVRDSRDLGMHSFMLSASKPMVDKLPSSVDEEPNCPSVVDQLSLGSCTANSAYCMRGHIYRTQLPYEKHKDIAAADFDISRLYVYYREREMEGTLPQDSGAQLRTICKVLNQFGACMENDMPYITENFNLAPTPDQTANAYNYHAGAYHRISTVQDMKACLASGYVFAMGFQVYESFESDNVANTGIMPMPKTDQEQFLGGHAVCVIGYDDDQGVFKVRNSWGSGWGSRGNFLMSYDIAMSPIVQDRWVQHLGSAWK